VGHELDELGLDHGDISYRVRVERLHRKYPEVYAVGRPDLTLDGAFLAAVRACGERAKLCRFSALRKYELRRGGTYRIDVVAPRSIKPKKGIRLHRPLNLDALDTTVVDGIPITTVAQTLLDVAAPRFRLNVAKLLHEAAVQELLDMRAIWSVLARNPRAPGARHLEEAVREEVPFTRSELEEAARRVYRSCSVPEPEWNRWVSDGEKLVEVDCLWRAFGLIVEIDSRRYHGTRWRRRQDAAKTAALRGQGWNVLRFWDAEINGTPARVAHTILAAMSGPRDSEYFAVPGPAPRQRVSVTLDRRRGRSGSVPRVTARRWATS
jgi:very-short-patch-repair endonuclease